jgi:hypothetical protein
MHHSYVTMNIESCIGRHCDTNDKHMTANSNQTIDSDPKFSCNTPHVTRISLNDIVPDFELLEMIDSVGPT